MNVLPTDTATDIRAAGYTIAVLPVGSLEQHGDHLPITTDTLVACLIAQEISRAENLMLLPPITMSCSHEHTTLGATVSIRSSTLSRVVNDVAESLQRLGIQKLVVVNGHGGNYVLSNVVQEANEAGPRMALFPSRADWDAAREAAGLETTTHDDMHAGELETSLLLHAAPELVRSVDATADHEASERSLMLTLGLKAYAPKGVIGSPSAATATKGEAILAALTDRFRAVTDVLEG